MTVPDPINRRELLVKLGLLFNDVVGVLLGVPIVRSDGVTAASVACWVRRVDRDRFQVFAVNGAHLGQAKRGAELVQRNAACEGTRSSRAASSPV